MGRPARVDFAGARHHVMNRGSRRQRIFVRPESRAVFLRLLAELPSRFGVVVYAYALMPNHWHVLLCSVRGNLSEAMRYLQAQFTLITNQSMGWDGPLFRGRFRNRLVCDEAYWRHLLAYVHANPRRAGFGVRAAWTSRSAYLGGPCPEWLNNEELSALFQSPAHYRAYEELVARREPIGPAGFDPADLWGPHETGLFGPWMPFHRPSASEALERVSAVCGVPTRSLLTVSPGTRAPETWVAAWWLNRRAGISQAEIARMLGVTQQAVSHRVRNASRMRELDSRVGCWLGELESAFVVESRLRAA